MADRPEMFGPTRGFFGDVQFNETMQNVVGPSLVAMTAKFRLGAHCADVVSYWLVCLSVCLQKEKKCYSFFMP